MLNRTKPEKPNHAAPATTGKRRSENKNAGWKMKTSEIQTIATPPRRRQNDLLRSSC